jgi:predicted ATPase
MSDITFGSLADLIRSNRNAREANSRAMEASSPVERAGWRVQIASFDQEYRKRLGEIEELPALLEYAMGVEENWPYPSDEALELLRAQVARLGHRRMTDVDALPLREVVAILRGNSPTSPRLDHEGRTGVKGIEEVDVSQLPRWARVAYVARCARKAYRLLLSSAPDQTADVLGWFNRAIEAAERSAAAGQADRASEETADGAIRRANGRLAQTVPYGAPARALPIYERLLSAAGNAAGEAARASLESESKAAAESFTQARGAALTVLSRATLDSMALEWNYLLALAKKENWTDDTPISPERVPSPSLKLTGLYVKGLRPIQKIELPRDGLGWGEKVPGLILLGGVNGSGKTTLLQFIAEALQLITRAPSGYFVDQIPYAVDAVEAWAEFEIEAYEVPKTKIRFIVGDEEFFGKNRGDNYWGFLRMGSRHGFFEIHGNDTIQARHTITSSFPNSTIPSALYFSSEGRTLVVPHEGYRAAGKLTTKPEFVYRWRRPTEWKDSLEAVLYSLRWEDLNAREERRYTATEGFEAYSEAFRRFTGDAKYLSWEEAQLVVRLANSAVRHDLVHLSSGEKQVLLLSGEILRHWKTGSLVMIDEPELHLHSIWQTKLYQALRFWQQERGGQVILATQSSHLFQTVDPGTAALLGVDSL